MKKAHKRATVAVTAIGVLGVVAAATHFYALPLLSIGTAYKAKILCSGLFVSRRSAQSILDTDLSADDLAVLRYVDARVDHDSRQVTADFLGLARRRAVYREGEGCAIVPGGVDELAAGSPGSARQPLPVQSPRADELERGEEPAPRLDQDRLNTTLEWAFSEDDPALPRRTRAVLVVYKGHLVAERYAQGFTKDTPLIGWSMTKSVVNALVGILAKEGKMSLRDAAPIPQWRSPGDPRGRITLEQLLRMNSGLEFKEDYSNPLADVTYMLLGVPDAAAYAIAKPLEAPPGRRWSYSSGTTNIIAYAIRQIVGDSDYVEFPRRKLFEPVGMASAVMETDAAGTFVGSSFMYATARDWARLGLLYLRDGVWAGQRILPEGWVEYTRAPVPNAVEQGYGAHFWLRIPKQFQCASNGPPLPADAFHAIGHEGQFITIIPSRDLVVVRLGFTRYPCAWDHQRFLNLMLGAIGNEIPAKPAPHTDARHESGANR